MRNGFIFKDRHSSDFGVTVRTKSRPILPSVKENIVDLPYRDGGYDFSKATPLMTQLSPSVPPDVKKISSADFPMRSASCLREASIIRGADVPNWGKLDGFPKIFVDTS